MPLQRARPIHLHRQHLQHLPQQTPTPLSRHITQRHMRTRRPQPYHRGMQQSQVTTASPTAATPLLRFPRHHHSSRLRPLRPMVRHNWHRGRHRQHNKATALYRRVRVMRPRLLLRAHLLTTTRSTLPRPPPQDSSTFRRTPRTDQVQLAPRLMLPLQDTHTRRLQVRRLIRVTRRYLSAPTTPPLIQIPS